MFLGFQMHIDSNSLRHDHYASTQRDAHRNGGTLIALRMGRKATLLEVQRF
jgi:hypothetical protein